MIYVSILSERAQRELEEAWTWYEEKQGGLGDRFTEAVFQKLKQLEDNPFKGSLRHSIYRESIVKVFPYIIIYTVEENFIFVHSIFHYNRNPGRKYSPA